jgi:Zn ribbon nucleic-acid-binding protein
MSDKLLPCPFCNSGDVMAERNHSGWPIVRCMDCGASGPCVGRLFMDAEKLWNARSLTEVLPGVPKTLQIT